LNIKPRSLTKNELAEVKTLLAAPREIVIITHKNPDADAMGSSLGLYNYLLKKNHRVTVITPTSYPKELHWMSGNDKSVDFKAEPRKAASIIDQSEVIFFLDLNALSRIDGLAELVLKRQAIKILLDHHLDPEGFAKYVWSDTTACSTAQIIYEFIEALGEPGLVDKDIANCLYAGIMTDTGSFRFDSTTAQTHRIVAALIERGAENSKVHQLIYDNSSLDRLRLLGYCLNEKLEVLREFHTAFISLSDKEKEKFNHQNGDTEGVVNYALSMEGINFAAFFSENKGEIRISFRSKGNFAANLFSKNHFSGGGHKNAAGGISYLSLNETIAKFKTLLPQYKDELSKAK
jgi:phosphoesterase RecJ-like protein